jgi:hypothetical protein
MLIYGSNFLKCSALVRNLDNEFRKESTYLVETDGLVLIRLLFILKYARWKTCVQFWDGTRIEIASIQSHYQKFQLRLLTLTMHLTRNRQPHYFRPSE